MQLFICIQKDYAALEQLLLAFVEYDLPGATLLDGRGMGQAIGRDLAVFADHINLFPDADADSHVLLFVGDEAQINLCFELTNKISVAARGIALALPIARFAYLGASAEPEPKLESESEPHLELEPELKPDSEG